jgi:hypothetical protein
MQIAVLVGNRFWFSMKLTGKSQSLFGTQKEKPNHSALYHQRWAVVKLLPLPQPPVRARMDAGTNPSAQRATQLRSVLARVYAVSIQNQITTTVP